MKSLEKEKSLTQETELKKQVTERRWKTAQGSEKELWSSMPQKSLEKEGEKYFRYRANYFFNRWKKLMKINKRTLILQIGCGPLDIINYFPKASKYSIDPLAEIYKSRFRFNYKETRLQKGVGENLPHPNKYFDIVLLMNVLDHMHSPQKALSEINRVLKKKGIFYFECNIYQKKFIQLSKIWGFLKRILTREIFNINHPYMFTLGDIKNLLSKDFKIVEENLGKDIGLTNNLKELKEKKRKHERITVRIPAKFGLFGTIIYSCLLRKK